MVNTTIIHHVLTNILHRYYRASGARDDWNFTECFQVQVSRLLRSRRRPDDLLLTVNHPCSQSIKRVVFTSSGATIMQESDTPVVLTEKDWNIECLEMFKELRGNAPDSVKYRASKVFAEQGGRSTPLLHCTNMLCVSTQALGSSCKSMSMR